MPQQSHFYIIGAFVISAGLIISWRAASSDTDLQTNATTLDHRNIAQLGNIRDKRVLREKLLELANSLSLDKNDIKEGIEGCIGNTPLIRIKSLSEATGCDILAKAEVGGPDKFAEVISLLGV